MTLAFPSSSVSVRHRASNMFLDGYKRNWIHTEGCSFEDRMINDLSVSLVNFSGYFPFLLYPVYGVPLHTVCTGWGDLALPARLMVL